MKNKTKTLKRTKPNTGKKRCSCGYRIRGNIDNHNAGTHHSTGRAPSSKQGWRWALEGSSRNLTKVESHNRRTRR